MTRPPHRESTPFNTEGTDTQGMKMLREELRKNPTLKVFFTAEPWKDALIPGLITDGYLRPNITNEGRIHSYLLTEKCRSLHELSIVPVSTPKSPD